MLGDLGTQVQQGTHKAIAGKLLDVSDEKWGPQGGCLLLKLLTTEGPRLCDYGVGVFLRAGVSLVALPLYFLGGWISHVTCAHSWGHWISSGRLSPVEGKL